MINMNPWCRSLKGELEENVTCATGFLGGPRRYGVYSNRETAFSGLGYLRFRLAAFFAGGAEAVSCSARAWFSARRRLRNSLRAWGLMV